jgi:hypothetical protein
MSTVGATTTVGGTTVGTGSVGAGGVGGGGVACSALLCSVLRACAEAVELTTKKANTVMLASKIKASGQ